MFIIICFYIFCLCSEFKLLIYFLHIRDIWRGTARLPQGTPVHYRYFVCVTIPADGERLEETARVVKRWETHPDPRAILPKGK